VRRIKKEAIEKKLKELAKDYRIFAPMNGDVKETGGEFEECFPRLSGKCAFLPPEEEILRYKDGKVEETPEDKPIILFGIKPCDARAISLIELAMRDEKFPDVYFLRKKEKGIIVSIACKEPGDTCFCTSFGHGPFSTQGSDALLVEKDDYYLVLGNEKFFKLFGEGEEAREEDKEYFEEAKKRAEEKIEKIPIDNLGEKLLSRIEDPVWEKISRKCLNCGACTFLCPTCYCFDIQDLERSWGVSRRRYWDSCMFSIYTKEASGHNPRPTHRERVRNRIMHKFSYYPYLYGEFGCTGCGRCVVYCPVNFDIREVLKILGGSG